MGRKITGRGATYKESLRLWITSPYYRVEVKSGSMMEHQRQMHGTETKIHWNQLPVSQTEHLT